MTYLTIAIDEKALRRARIRALERGLSINAVLRNLLEDYAGIRSDRKAAIEKLLALSEQSTSGSSGLHWTRDDVHERS